MTPSDAALARVQCIAPKTASQRSFPGKSGGQRHTVPLTNRHLVAIDSYARISPTSLPAQRRTTASTFSSQQTKMSRAWSGCCAGLTARPTSKN